MDYVIIGNSAAGIGAIEGIRKVDQEGKITVISDEEYHTYSRPLISYYLAEQVSAEQMKYRGADFYQEYGVETRLGDRVVKVDQDDKLLALESGEEINFNKLLVATGGTPFIPPITGANKDNIYTFIKLDDSKAIAQEVEEGDIKEVVILGAGLIGLKAAEALVKLGVKVTVVELADRVLSAILDQDAAEIVQQNLEAKGIEFVLEDTIEEFSGTDRATAVKLKSGQQLKTDLAIIAVGVRPNTELVQDTEVELNRGVIVDDQLETNISGIYAAGDVSEGYDLVRGSAAVIPIWPNAYRQGLVAGQNMAGASESYNEGFVRNSIGFFGLPMITAGIINPEGDGYEVLSSKLLENNSYRKVVLQEGKIVGFIYLTDIDRAGILTGLIKEEQDVSQIKEELLADDFGYLSFSEEERRKLLWL
ncbi:FAD-dependent oxidoreductase [Natroniella acetigena]|uniref:NAD(P)/FAD-dependent oxidoreductase n=1 Tax=Natroniella acetigena TaxID=52004 RepID=UPI00200A5399|nr:FAD-dependent oxidoreductase [Natroniella acetigena]